PSGGQLLDELGLGELLAVLVVGSLDELDLAVGAVVLDRGVPPARLLAEPDLLHCSTPSGTGTTAVPSGVVEKGRLVTAGWPLLSSVHDCCALVVVSPVGARGFEPPTSWSRNRRSLGSKGRVLPQKAALARLAAFHRSHSLHGLQRLARP